MAIIPGVYQAKNAISDDSQQGSKFNSIVNAIVNPANTSLLTGFDPVIEEVSSPNVGTVVTYTPQTVSGTPPLSLPNSLGKPLKAWEVDVLPKQDLNGYDSPWPAGGGANKWDEETELGTLSTVDGSEIASSAIIRTKNYVPVDSDKSYYVVCSDQMWMMFFDENKDIITTGLPSGAGAANNARNYRNGWTMTLPTNCKYVRWYFSIEYGTIYKHDAALNYPSTVITYSPYANLCPIHGTDKLNLFVEESYDLSATPKAVLTLPSTVYTGTVGSEGGESRWGEVDLGTLNWIYHSAHDVFYYVTQDGKPTGTGQSGYGMCEAYNVMEGTYYTALANGQMAVGTNFFSATTASIVVKDTRFTDAAQFKTAVSGVKLVYEIADPATFAVPSVTIPTPRGSATTWATAEDGTVESMEVTYLEEV